MKKLILVITILLLTGCVDGNKDFEVTCNKKEQINDFIEDISYKIYFNYENNITKLIETHSLKYTDSKEYFDSAKSALNSYNNTINYTKEILKDNLNEYEVSYIFDIDKLSDKQIEDINSYQNHIKIKRNYYDQVNIYKDNNIICSK